MEFSDSPNMLWFVGNHAKGFLNENPKGNAQYLTFKSDSFTEGSGGHLHCHGQEPVPCESYTPIGLSRALENIVPCFNNILLIGDPSEWLVSATIMSAMKKGNLSIVLLIYPVGMLALDSRKEMSELILELKKNHIPTYLMRDPVLFFKSVEPILNPIVKAIKKREKMGTKIEYLCGHRLGINLK